MPYVEKLNSRKRMNTNHEKETNELYSVSQDTFYERSDNSNYLPVVNT